MEMETHKEPYTVPGKAHKILDDTVGSFTYTIRMWDDPNGDPVEETGKCLNKWILGGRFIEQQITGTTMPSAPFAGVGIIGYDNFRDEYQSVWMDNMSTGITWSNGKNTGNTRVIEQTGTISNPTKNDKAYWFKTVLHIINKDEHTYVMYAKDENGKEYKRMEIKYQRS